VFTAFATSGDLARHLRRLRRELGERRSLLVEALAGVPLRGDRAGAHVLVPLPDATTARAVRAAAAERGVGLEVLERYAGTGAPGGIVLGYAGPTRAAFEAALPVLAEVLTGSPNGR
jgi:GntR family transcriptional regulator/MocR family aminotransferase